MSGFLEFISTQRYEFMLLAIVILTLIVYLKKNKDKIHTQKILSFGPFAIISMILVKTGWGIGFMDSMAKKHPLTIKLFGFISVILGFIGMFIQSLAMFWLVYVLFNTPQVQGVTLALPFTNIPYLGYLSFSHWIIAIFIMATVHEFAHGVVARYYKIPVNSSGFAVLNILLPIIPAAFVEPDPKKFEKAKPYKRYAVLTAGPVSNILLAIPFFLLLVFVMQPFYADMTEPVGMSFMEITESMPAELAGVKAGQVYTYYNGQNITNASIFFNDMQENIQVGDNITLGYYENNTLQVKTIQTTTAEDNESRAVIGVIGLYNERDYKDGYSTQGSIFWWFMELVRWLFLFNLFIGLTNLLPLFITDGGQIVQTMSNQFIKNKKVAKRVYVWVCNVFLAMLLAGLIVPFFFS